VHLKKTEKYICSIGQISIKDIKFITKGFCTILRISYLFINHVRRILIQEKVD